MRYLCEYRHVLRHYHAHVEDVDDEIILCIILCSNVFFFLFSFVFWLCPIVLIEVFFFLFIQNATIEISMVIQV